MIERFEMERMQSTWENIVDYDMSESGVRPLTLRELVDMGFDLDAFLDQPLGTVSRMGRSSSVSGSQPFTQARQSTTSKSPMARQRRTI